MKKYSILLTLLGAFLCYTTMFAQPEPRFKWVRSGSEANVALSATDTVGNTIVFGSFNNADFSIGAATITGITAGESPNLFLAKFNSAGKLLWLKGIYGIKPGASLEPKKLAINDHGDIAIIGNALYTGDIMVDHVTVSFANENQNLFVAKFHQAGRLLWVRIAQVMGDSAASGEATDVAMNNSGEIFVTGSFIADSVRFNLRRLNGHPVDRTFFLVKYGPLGTVEWAEANRFDGNGDNGLITGLEIALDAASNVYVSGELNGYREFYIDTDTLKRAGGYDCFLLKYNAEGMYQWNIPIYGNGEERPDRIVVNPDGNVFMSGLFNSSLVNIGEDSLANSSGDYDLFVLRVNPQGAITWRTTLDTRLISPADPGKNSQLTADPDNNAYLIAMFQGTTVLKNALLQANEDPGTTDILITRLNNATGNPEWSNSARSIGDNWLNSVTFDRFENTYFATNLQNSGVAMVDVLQIKDTLGYGGFYIAKINKTGDVGYSKSLLNRNNSTIDLSKLSVDFFGNLYLSGTYTGQSNELDGLLIDTTLNSGVYMAKFAYNTDITGHIRDMNENPVTQGYVKLYGFTWFQRSPVSDSVQINPDGSYLFKAIPFGRYILFAKPRSSAYPGAAPTYYPSLVEWNEAEPVIVFGTNPLTDIDITVRNIPLLTGTAILTGMVFETDTTYTKSTSKIQAKPVKDITVVLIGQRKKDIGGDVIAVVTTDENGDFVFTNIQSGSYYLYVDEPGIPHHDYYHVIVLNGQLIGNLNYEVGEEEIYAINLPDYTDDLHADDQRWSLFPNPCGNSFSLMIYGLSPADSPLEISIFMLTGQLVEKVIINNPGSENAVNHHIEENGLYILRFTLKNRQYTGKLMVR